MKSHSTSYCKKKKKSRSSTLVTLSYECSRNLASWFRPTNFRTQSEYVRELRRCLSYSVFPWTPIIAPPLQLVCVCLLWGLTKTDSTRLPIPAGALPHTDSQSWPGFQGIPVSLSFAGPCELWLREAGRQLLYVLAMTLEFWTPAVSGTHLLFPKQKATHEVISPADVDRAHQVLRQLC